MLLAIPTFQQAPHTYEPGNCMRASMAIFVVFQAAELPMQ